MKSTTWPDRTGKVVLRRVCTKCEQTQSWKKLEERRDAALSRSECSGPARPVPPARAGIAAIAGALGGVAPLPPRRLEIGVPELW